MNAPSSPRSAWLVGPAFDLVCVANLGWVLLCIPGLVPVEGPSAVSFWQVYFLTTPHRWITLWLVATDPDRRGGRSWRFVAIALAAAAVVVGAWLITGALLCLAWIDYVWNSWHFGAQHGGIFRMYSRKAGGGRPRLETWGMRVLVVYTALRLAGWTTGWLEKKYPQVLDAIAVVDFAMLAIPLGLLALDLATWSKDKLPKTVYLASVGLLYGGLLVALNARHTALVASLSLAGAVFHATEYLAIVTHYAWRRKTTGSAGLFQRASQQWLLVLLTFLVGWGLFAYAFEQGYAMLWAGVNFWAAALHYAYDGLIWKLRLPATAQALGVDVARPSAN